MANSLTFNSLNLLSGTLGSAGYALVGDVPQEGDVMAWDAVRSYSGTWRQVDLHTVPYPLTLTVLVFGTSAENCQTNVGTLRTNCLAGGTLTFGWGSSGSRAYTVWPSQVPSVTYNNTYNGATWAEATIVLTICP